MSEFVLTVGLPPVGAAGMFGLLMVVGLAGMLFFSLALLGGGDDDN